jgi:polysaccharide export outer membrane protein
LRNRLIPFAAAILLSGCAGLPASGPGTRAVVQEAGSGSSASYRLIELNYEVADRLQKRDAASLADSFQDGAPPAEPRIGVGDALAITIWEAGPGGLFSAPMAMDRISTGPKSATIPEQVVGRDGTITVPYAGRIKVAGRTTSEVEDAVVAALAGKAIEPQVLVSIPHDISNSVTVLGEVVRGNRVPLTPRGDRILDVLATTGGVNAPVGETFVRLTRNGRTRTVALGTIVARPSENIFARPGDSITVIRDPQTFLVLGASAVNGELPFNADGISLAQALAKVGGLSDARADRLGVFVFRYERADAPEAGALPMSGNQADTPVVYRLDMSDPNSLFVAQRFPIADQDLIYIANAPLADLQKALQIFLTLATPVTTGAATYSAVSAAN